MGILNERKAFRQAILGDRVERPLALLPQTTATAYFTVVGGRVMIMQLLGEVTTAIETQANDTKWTATPTVGTAADICAALDITADEAGALYGITGILANAMVGAVAGALAEQSNGVIVNAGTLDLDCAASNTGATKWSLFYIPLDVGAYVEIA